MRHCGWNGGPRGRISPQAGAVIRMTQTRGAPKGYFAFRKNAGASGKSFPFRGVQVTHGARGRGREEGADEEDDDDDDEFILEN